DDSVYKDKVRGLADKARTDFVAEMTARARALAAVHKCKDIAKLAQQAGKLWAEAKEAVDQVNCVEPATSSTPPGGGTHNPPGGGGGSGSAEPIDKNPPPSGSNPAQLLDDARAAAKNSQWGKALRLCEEALQSDRSNTEAVMVCALASCNLKN